MKLKTPFSEAEAHDSTGFLLWQATSIWQRRVADVLRPHGLTQVQFVLLASLLWLTTHKNKQVTQTLLARHAKLNVMMTSQVLRALESRGLVTREAHPDDSRAKILQLTARGCADARKTVPLVEKVDAEFFGKVGNKRLHLNDLLRRLAAE